MKNSNQAIKKFYLINISLVICVILSIIFTFVVEFKVESLQEEMSKTESEIAAYEDEIQLMEVEWVYLTRPERVRVLASHYLKDNGYALASQIKDAEQLEKYYVANYRDVESEEVIVASNQDISF